MWTRVHSFNFCKKNIFDHNFGFSHFLAILYTKSHFPLQTAKKWENPKFGSFFFCCRNRKNGPWSTLRQPMKMLWALEACLISIWFWPKFRCLVKNLQCPVEKSPCKNLLCASKWLYLEAQFAKNWARGVILKFPLSNTILMDDNSCNFQRKKDTGGQKDPLWPQRLATCPPPHTHTHIIQI